MISRLIISFVFFVFTSVYLNASVNNIEDILQKPDKSTSFMLYKAHSIAYKAGKRKDYKTAFNQYLEMAKKGDNVAQYNVGIMYLEGIGVKPKKASAYKWLRRAAKQGNVKAIQYFKQITSKNKKLQKSGFTKEHLEPKTSLQALNLLQNSALSCESNASETYMPDSKSGSYFLYIFLVAVLLFLSISLYILKKRVPLIKNENKGTYEKSLSNITNYFNEVFKETDISQYKDDNEKLQIYYMFTAGVIDYFCQLENCSENEQRRVFNSHIKNVEKELEPNVILQAILKGQRTHKLFHYRAAGAVSAQEWHTKKSKKALNMLKTTLQESAD